MATQPNDRTQSSATGADTGTSTRVARNEKLSCGTAALDAVLGGGIPGASLLIVAGPPGAGKTILAQQIAFRNAKHGQRVIYFTNVSEPHAKLVQHIRNFAFFEPTLIGERILIYNITSQIRNAGFKATLDFIVDTVRREKAGLIIVDSFRGLKHVLEVDVRDRSAIFDMAAQLSILGCTTILVGEYTPHEIQTDPEFAIADGILNLWHAAEGVQERRSLRIGKMRGVRYLGGEHSFEIDDSGIAVYPRQEALTQAPSYRATEERVSMGLGVLDEMMNGGAIRSSSTLIAGAAGTGKTVLSLHFLAAGAAQGERGLMISFQENPAQLLLRASHFGLAKQPDMLSEHLEILHLSPVELNLDLAAAKIREAVERHAVRRVVIDSVAELESAVYDPERFDDFLASLVGFLRGNEVTTVMTREVTQLLGPQLSISSRGLSYIVDNIILLRYIELHAELRRAVAVVKNRGSDHDKSLREFAIANNRVVIGPRFQGLAGLMTGLPRSLSDGVDTMGGTVEEQ